MLNYLHGDASPEFKKAIGLQDQADYEPCEDDYATTYLNLPEVKAALHVEPSLVWEECSTSIRYAATDRPKDMTWIYNYLIDGENKLKILVYSGDDDSVCSTLGTQSWIWDLGYDMVGRKWQEQSLDGQHMGALTQWEGISFLTVHGAGHEVPTYQPKYALTLFEQYLDGTLTTV